MRSSAVRVSTRCMCGYMKASAWSALMHCSDAVSDALYLPGDKLAQVLVRDSALMVVSGVIEIVQVECARGAHVAQPIAKAIPLGVTGHGSVSPSSRSTCSP